MKDIVNQLLNKYGMKSLLEALIELTDNSFEEYIKELNTGFRKVLASYEKRYDKQEKECEHNWVMDGHNAGDPICSKCYKR